MTVIPFPVQPQKQRAFLGHAVKDGKIRYSSVTQITMFDPTEEGGCNRRWLYQYVRGVKPEKTQAQLKGADFAEKLEHYLKTGELVLPRELQEAQKFFPEPGPDLEVEQPLGDIAKAVELRDVLLRGTPGTWPNVIEAEIKKFAGLVAAGVPLSGAADYRHRRGEYIDEEGVLRREQAGIVVTEIGDLKSTKRINSRWTKGRTTFLQGYAKTSAQVCEQTQMIAYGLQEIDRHPEVTHVRLSHVYAQKESPGAAKRTGLLSTDTIRERWARIDGVMLKMIDVATADKVEDVEPNTNACDAYMGCPHRLYCPLSESEFVPHMLGTINKENQGMSLFDTVTTPAPAPTNGVSAQPPAPPAPPTAALDDAQHAALVAIERARLLAEDAVIQAKGKIAAGMLKLDGSGAVYAREGADSGWILRPPTDAERAAFVMGVPGAPASGPPAPPNLNAVLPPDAPPPASLINAAAPLPPTSIAEIVDPALRATAVAHAAIHADRAAAEAAAEEAAKSEVGEGGVWCPGGKQRIQLTIEMALARKMTCQCGKPIALKPVKEGEVFVATIPRHKPPKSEGEVVATPPAPPVLVAPLPPVAPAPPTPPTPPTTMSQAAAMIDEQIVKAQARVKQPQRGITLYVVVRDAIELQTVVAALAPVCDVVVQGVQ